MAQFLKHAPSGRIYPWTEALAERVDMLPYSGPDPFAKGRRGVGRRPAPAPRGTEPSGEASRPDPHVLEQQRVAQLKERYQAEFDRPPHPNMKPETIEARLAEAEAERLMKAEQVPIPSQTDNEDDGEGEGEGFGFGDDVTQET